MNVLELWKQEEPSVSFEVFPTRSEKAAINFEQALAELAALKPNFMSVTFGAGGSTRDGSLQLVKKLQSLDIHTMAYFAGFGLAPDEINSVLSAYKEIGVRDVLIVRGDPPHDADNFKPHPNRFKYASEILEFVRPQFDFTIGVAGYPEGHIANRDMDKNIEILKMKVDKGAQFIISNYFYDNNYYFDFVKRARQIGIGVPIIPGIMPIFSIKMMNMLAGLCGTTIPDEIKSGLDLLPEGDPEALLAFGIQFATRQCRELLGQGVPGIHLYTMDKSASTMAIVNKLRCEGVLPKR